MSRANPYLPLCIALLALSIFVMPVFARRAITVAIKANLDTTDNLGSNATPYVTTSGTWETNEGSTSFSLASGTLGICLFAHSDGDAPEAISAVTQTGQTWTVHATSITSNTVASPLNRLSFAHTVGQGAASAGLTINTTNDNQTGMIVQCLEITGATTSGTNGADAIIEVKTSQNDASTTHSTTLDNRSAGSLYLHAYMADGGGTATTSLGASTASANYSAPSTISRTQWDINEGADVTVATMTITSADGASIGIEISEAAVAASGTTKFAPLMGVGLRPR